MRLRWLWKMNEAELIKEIVAEGNRTRILAGVKVDPSQISDEGRRTDKTGVAKNSLLSGCRMVACIG